MTENCGNKLLRSKYEGGWSWEEENKYFREFRDCKWSLGGGKAVVYEEEGIV